ncbi:MAG: cytochrome c3 family protein [Planctomycetota bacterium]
MVRTRWIAPLVAAPVALACGLAFGGLTGSKHDFRKKEWSGGEGCAACHTPQSPTPPRTPPKWDPNADLSRTFGASLARSKAAGIGTTLCLRCHDGTIARETASAATDRFPNLDNPARIDSGHRGSDHPVGIAYPNVDRGYRPASSVVASGTVTLPGGKVECTSCHDPHDMSGEKHMLVRGNARSALCLTCHRK